MPRHAMRLPLLSICLLLCAASANEPDPPPVRNGFTLSPSSVPASEILAGGPPRDGIPALTNPQTVSAAQAAWHDDEMMVGVVQGGVARAYPVAILNWHELVNDTLGGHHILVSYCPLCGTALVFDREVDGQIHHFGVSGLLYRSDLLLYDHESQSLWSQIASRAVTGPAIGQRLKLQRSALVPWKVWKLRHPSTRVLTLETGHRRPYERDPYNGYAESAELLFPAPLDRRYHPKMPTLGLRVIEGPSRAYPAAELERAGGQVEESFAGHPIRVSYDAAAHVFDVEAPADVEVIEGYWFAWAAFHPSSSVFVVDPDDPARYRLQHSGSEWRVVRGDRVLDDLRDRYADFFNVILDPEARGEPDLRPLRDDLEHQPIDRRNFDALNAIAIGYFELNARAEAGRGGTGYLGRSFGTAKLAAVPWRAYGEVSSGELRDAILDFFEDAASGEKLGSATTASRLGSIVASLGKKEQDPERRRRIARIVGEMGDVLP